MAYCQAVDLTAWGRFIFRNGRLIRSNWRWRLLPIRLIAMLLCVGALFVLTVLQLIFVSTVPVQATLVQEALALTAFAAISLRAWVHAIHDRLRPAPDELLAIGDPAQIEILGSGPSTESRLVRYTATCAVCTGEIRVQPGEPDFPRRMVGRCLQSPREHVFSFNRITLLGGALIVPPRDGNAVSKRISSQVEKWSTHHVAPLLDKSHLKYCCDSVQTNHKLVRRTYRNAGLAMHHRSKHHCVFDDGEQ